MNENVSADRDEADRAGAPPAEAKVTAGDTRQMPRSGPLMSTSEYAVSQLKVLRRGCRVGIVCLGDKQRGCITSVGVALRACKTQPTIMESQREPTTNIY